MPGRPVWRAPSKPPIVLDECPASFITNRSAGLVRDFQIAKLTGQPPLSKGFYAWPAPLVDAWLVLEHEWALLNRQRDKSPRQPYENAR